MIESIDPREQEMRMLKSSIDSQEQTIKELKKSIDICEQNIKIIRTDLSTDVADKVTRSLKETLETELKDAIDTIIRKEEEKDIDPDNTLEQFLLFIWDFIFFIEFCFSLLVCSILGEKAYINRSLWLWGFTALVVLILLDSFFITIQLTLYLLKTSVVPLFSQKFGKKNVPSQDNAIKCEKGDPMDTSDIKEELTLKDGVNESGEAIALHNIGYNAVNNNTRIGIRRIEFISLVLLCILFLTWVFIPGIQNLIRLRVIFVFMALEIINVGVPLHIINIKQSGKTWRFNYIAAYLAIISVITGFVSLAGSYEDSVKKQCQICREPAIFASVNNDNGNEVYYCKKHFDEWLHENEEPSQEKTKTEFTNSHSE